jgi:phospholipase C
VNRRDAIKALGTAVGAASMSPLLSACGDNIGSEDGITTYVFLMMENRTYDHYFGARSLLEGRGGDGLVAGMSNADSGGAAIEIFPADTSIEQMCLSADPPHGWESSRIQLAGGDNSGFVLAHQQRHGAGRIDPMAYMTRETLPVSWALADQYATCDRWFASLLGPTLPNRMYWHAGTSNGAQDNDTVLGGAFRGVTSIYHRLAEAGIDWAYYYGDLPVVAFVDDLDLDGHIRRFSELFADAEAGKLPPVVYIDPSFTTNDDHPPHHPLLGQQLISAVYTALATSPQWNNCMLVVTYDEHGGFFDHVSPPTAADDRAAEGFDQLGFRVPALVAGPYVKGEHVSSVIYDHTSALKHLENHFALAPLTARSSAANDLADCIDLERLAAGDPAPPIELPPVDIDSETLPQVCFSGEGLRQPSHDIHRWADAEPGRVARWDRRAHATEDLLEIAAYLERHGRGSIR